MYTGGDNGYLTILLLDSCPRAQEYEPSIYLQNSHGGRWGRGRVFVFDLFEGQGYITSSKLIPSRLHPCIFKKKKKTPSIVSYIAPIKVRFP